MNPDKFKQRIQEIENPNELDEIKDDLNHLIEQAEATHTEVTFGHYSNELEEEVTQMDEAVGHFNHRMSKHIQDLKAMRDATQRKMESL